MLPIAIVNTPVPVPLVNTPLPGTAVVHVPYDNVAPSISNAQVDNNASPNSDAAAAEEPPDAQAGQTAQDEQAAAANNVAQTPGSSPQAVFLAQLLSQDGSPTTQVILVQYEKMNAMSNVKYKPSNAMKPVAQPSSLFGKILQQNKATPVQPPSQSPPRPQAASPAALTAEAEIVLPGQAPEVASPRPASRNTSSSASATHPAPQISAYSAAAARVDTQNADITTALA